MGLGDALMAAGEARKFYERTGQHVCITRVDGRPLWSEVWENIEYIRRAPGVNIVSMVNAGNARPYIVGKTETKWTWRAYTPIPAQIVFSDAERRFAEPYRGLTLLEPNIKPRDGNNKRWPWRNWEEVAKYLHGYVIQVGPHGTSVLPGVRLVTTKTFRLATAVLSVCKACIVHEGALMHAAAALGVPAIVIRGEFIGPAVTGYNGQIDFFTGNGLGCGARVPCKGCAKAMDAITVDMVLESYEGLL